MKDKNLKEKLSEINNLVAPAIEKILVRDVEPLNAEIAAYQCSVGGKRIRPALVVLSGQVFGANPNDLANVAASIEIMHNSTLIIDDIIDHSEFRRNEPTTWSKYGKSIAECASFMYLASIFSGLSLVNNNAKIIDLFGVTLKVIIDGEIKDILFERSGREDEKFVVEHRYKHISKDDYFEMIGQKTAVLLQASCKAGALCANADDEQVICIGDFGYNLGMAFQIRDDILDIFGDEKEFGKKIGKDIIEKKMGNYIILTALEQLEPEDADKIRAILNGHNDVTDEDVKKVTDLIAKTNAKENAEMTANLYIQDAFSQLKKLPQNEHAEYLREIALYIVDRNK